MDVDMLNCDYLSLCCFGECYSYCAAVHIAENLRTSGTAKKVEHSLPENLPVLSYVDAGATHATNEGSGFR